MDSKVPLKVKESSRRLITDQRSRSAHAQVCVAARLHSLEGFLFPLEHRDRSSQMAQPVPDPAHRLRQGSASRPKQATPCNRSEVWKPTAGPADPDLERHVDEGHSPQDFLCICCRYPQVRHSWFCRLNKLVEAHPRALPRKGRKQKWKQAFACVVPETLQEKGLCSPEPLPSGS